MVQRVERHVDRMTGEERVVDVEEVGWKTPKRTDGRYGKASDKRQFVMEIRETTWRTDDLTVVEHRVWNALKRRMQFAEPFYLSTKEIAQELNMTSPWVSRTLRSLREKELLIHIRERWFMLDPRVVWMGSDRDRKSWLGRLYNTRRLSVETAFIRSSPEDIEVVTPTPEEKP